MDVAAYSPYTENLELYDLISTVLTKVSQRTL